MVSMHTDTARDVVECQKHAYFMYLVRRLKLIAPHIMSHKLCLIKEADPDIPS